MLRTKIYNMALMGKKSKDITEKRILLNGIISELLLAKTYAERNSELPLVTEKLLKTQFKEYVYKSRTLVISRTIREIESLSVKEIHETFDNIIELTIDAEENEGYSKKKSRHNSVLESINKWKKVINYDSKGN